MDNVVPDSERISCEELIEFLDTAPEVRCCFASRKRSYHEARIKVEDACKKLKIANNNLKVLK